MPAATIIGDQLPFGIGNNDEAGLVTHTIKSVTKKDKKEARDRYGNVVSVAHFNEQTDLTIEGLGNITASCGAVLVLQNVLSPAVTGVVVVDEVAVDRVNDDYQKTSVKATAYANMTA